MFSSKLSQDFKINGQHRNIANDIKFKKKKEIGKIIIQCDNQHCQNCNNKLICQIAKLKQ
jgi:hypothetical protein